MIGILHRYILRELLKTFALTAVGLTLMFGMGGGLLNLIRIESIGASDVARLLLWFFPLVASFMLPIAALLSCALVYGRLAADSELDACKASGINILRLLASAIGLALVVGVVSFYLSNFTVPRLFQRIDEIAQRDLQDILVARLREQGHISFKDYVIYADNARKLEPEEAGRVLGEKSSDKEVVFINGAAFVQYREEDPVRTGTAETILLVFDRSQSPPELSAQLLEVRVFDHNPPRFSRLKDPMIEKAPIRALGRTRTRMKFCTLEELFDFRQDPARTENIKLSLEQFRQSAAGLALIDKLKDSLQTRGYAEIEAKGSKYRIQAEYFRPDLEGYRAKLLLKDKIRIEHTVNGHLRTYRADEGEVSLQPAQDAINLNATLRRNVTLLDPRETRKEVNLASPVDTPAMSIPLASLQQQVPPLPNETILDREVVLPIPQPLQESREALIEQIEALRLQITAAINSRITISIGTVVLVLLAASLGIVIRGGHALTAFGAAFIPTVVVVLVITTGRSLAEHGTTAILGICVMWGVIALMTVVDTVLVFGYIRR